MTPTWVKPIAAVLVVCGGLAAGFGPAVVPDASAQPAAGGPADPPAVPDGGSVITGALAQSGSRATSPADPAAGRRTAATAPSGPPWEYAYHDTPGSRKGLEDLLGEEGRKGWEFGGVVEARGSAMPYTVVVLKRRRAVPIGGPGGGGFGGGGGLGGMSGFGGGGGFGGVAQAGLLGGSPANPDRAFDIYAEQSGGKDVIDWGKIPQVVRETLNRGAETAGLASPAFPETGTMTRKEFTDRYMKMYEAAHSRAANGPSRETAPAPGAAGGTAEPARGNRETAPAAGGARRGGAGGPTGGAGPTEGEVANIRVLKLRNAQATELGNTLSQLFRTRASIVADARTNSLVVSASDSTMKAIAVLIDELDTPSVPAPSVPVPKQ